jgi:hypothetical protein
MPWGRRPVTANGGLTIEQALRRAYRERLLREAEFFNLPGGTRPTLAEVSHQIKLLSDTVELEGWAYPDIESPKQRAIRIARIEEMSLPYQFAKLLIDSMKRRKGAPIKPEIRQAAIRVLEEKRLNKAISWMQFAIRDCPKDERGRVLKYKERVRQAAMELQGLTRRLQISY